MPTHKKPQLLHATLLSVLSQKYDCWELIVVDASPDGYFEETFKDLMKNNHFLKRYKNKVSNVKIVRPDKDRDLPGAMKMYGFFKCMQDNDFCIFLDHDDFLYNDSLIHIHNAYGKFPDTEMIGMDYTSMVWNGSTVFDNTKTLIGGHPCGELDRIYVDGYFWGFNQPQKIWRNTHPYKACIHPKIIKKNIIRDNRFSFITNTETMDDFGWPILSHALKETYITKIGYVYIAYPGSNSVLDRKVSETAINIKKICNEYDKLLESMNYKKPRNIYNPE